MKYHFDGGYICKYVCVSVQCGNKQQTASRLRLWKREYSDTWKTRCVDDMPTSEVTSVTIPFIHPPHHGYTKVTVMVINDRLTSLSLHVNRPSDFWDKSMSNIALEKSRPRPCLWSNVRVTHLSQYPIDLLAYTSHQSDQQFLTWSYFKRAISKFDLEKFKVKLMGKIKGYDHIVDPADALLFVSHKLE